MKREPTASEPFEPHDLRCEYLIDPIGIDDRIPRLGWKIDSRRTAARQIAYRIQVASSLALLESGIGDLWDSGRVESDQSLHLHYGGAALQPRQSCHWRVKCWDERGSESAWSVPARWEMGLMGDDQWTADWISLDLSRFNRDREFELPPSPYLRKSFTLGSEVVSARLYITALGLYEASINGRRVGDLLLTPGWTDYSRRVHYQVYDVSHLLHAGENAMGVILSYGWYSGYVGYAALVNQPKVKDFYGKGAALRSQLEVVLADGSTRIVASGEGWKGSSGPICSSDLLMGESYDARKELAGWAEPGFRDLAWSDVEIVRPRHGFLEAYPGIPTRATQELPALTVHRAGRGCWIVDFGQNFAGVVRLRVSARRGQILRFRHGEMLHKDGTLMTENLRKARATDTYICSGSPEGETWMPRFTYHGFRYVEVSGLKEEPSLSLLTGIVMGSDTEVAGSFSTDNPLVNQLYQNIVWTQRANYLEVPTDCPQRDERLGWLGDAQIYINSACYNMGVAAFFKKWMRDVADSQLANGAYPNYAPFPFHRPRNAYSPAWMEAGLICPYFIHLNYGDRRILEEHYPSFVRFARFHLERVGDDMVYGPGSFAHILPHGGWGDWLSLGSKTPKYQIANLYFGYTLKLMSEIACTLGRQEEAEHFRGKLGIFQERFFERHVKGGKIKGETQTLCAMIVILGIMSEEVESIARRRLGELVERSHGAMSTGFIGSRFLLPALSEIGRSKEAYDLLCSVDFPGWGYSVVNGATTIWERWNSFSHTHGIHDPGMNSFSHYAFGAVCEWMFGYLAGIRPLMPGYAQVLLAPEIVRHPRIHQVSAMHRTLHGEVRSSWSLPPDGVECVWNVRLPAGTSGRVRLPPCAVGPPGVVEATSGAEVAVDLLSGASGRTEFELLAGEYILRLRIPTSAS